jgi:hypothetical protein
VRLLPFILSLTIAAACGEGAAPARRAIREVHVPEAIAAVREDLARHRDGIREAADRLAPGFAVDDPVRLEREMRTALKYVQEPPRGIGAFISSPMSFLAAIGKDGKVIARDAEPDRMRGADLGQRYPAVAEVLARGGYRYDLVEFPGEEGAEPSVSMLFVHAVRRDGEVVGAVAAGIPMWRMAQRLSRQLRANHADEGGLILWAYLYRDDRLFTFDAAPDVDALVPTHETRQAGLSTSPRGFTGEAVLHGRYYGFGLVTVPSIGDGVGLVVLRSDPT